MVKVEETTRACVHTNTLIVLRTADVEGKRRNSGGDPVTATLTYNGRERRDGDEHDDQLNPPVSVSDMGDGTYHIVFRYTFSSIEVH